MIYLASDHAGFELKEQIKESLKKEGIETEDCGATEFNKDDDYPDFISKAAREVSRDSENNKGIVFGGSGQAEMMVANKFKGVRCALFYGSAIPVRAVDVTGRKSADPLEMIKLTREHNNANMLSLGVRFITDEQALEVIKLWLNTPFPADERHLRRIEKIKKLEESL